MHQESPDELLPFQPLGLNPPIVPIIFISERDPVTLHRQQPPVTDGNPVSVASEIIDNRIGLVQAVPSVDNPFLL
ncbi:MAG: hypothetical protein RLN59_00725 [Haliea sp.]